MKRLLFLCLTAAFAIEGCTPKQTEPEFQQPLADGIYYLETTIERKSTMYDIEFHAPRDHNGFQCNGYLVTTNYGSFVCDSAVVEFNYLNGTALDSSYVHLHTDSIFEESLISIFELENYATYAYNIEGLTYLRNDTLITEFEKTDTTDVAWLWERRAHKIIKK